MAISLILLMFVATNLHEIRATRETKQISTKIGKVQGVIEPSKLTGKYVQKFLNIPYAEAPIGERRFAKPVPKKPWKGILKNSQPAVCWQEDHSNMNLTEDCLILNIWTPYPEKQNTSVMIFIHGGSFLVGRSAPYLGNNLVAAGDVILVTINYRLSVLGFLSTGDKRIKGNFGLFDQRLAMKWVKENIASFGGNPQSITIFGESAGGASTSAHTVSSGSWPYFDRAILQSGSITMPWATATRVIAKHALHLFLQNVNCTDDDRLLECLRNNVSVRDLERMYRSKPFVLEPAWTPPYIDGDFLIDDPIKLLNDGKVKKKSLILGVTKDESFLVAQKFIEKSRNISFLTKIFHDSLHKELKKKLKKNVTKSVYNEALKLYQPKCTPSFIEALKPTVAVVSDIYFHCDIVNEATIRSKILNSTNTYLYQYSYASQVYRPYYYPIGVFGFATHGLDTGSIFGAPLNNPKYPPDDQILSMRMILYWTNFAKNGDPNSGMTKLPISMQKVDTLPTWPKFTYSKREYLEMESLSRMIIKKRLREKYCDFWKDPEGFTKRTTTNVAVKHIAQLSLFVIVMQLSAIL